MSRPFRSALACTLALICVTALLAGPAAAASPGLKLWTRYYLGSHGGVNDSVAVAASDAAVFVTGVSSGATSGLDFFTIAYDSGSSQRLWGDRYDGPSHLDDSPIDIAASPDGSTVFVAGSSDNMHQGLLSTRAAVIAYDATTGERLWTKRIGSDPKYNAPRRIDIAPDGSTLYVAGLRSEGSDSDIRTMALDASTGAVTWTAKFEGSQQYLSFVSGVRVARDGAAVYVVGTIANATGGKTVTIAYDASGAKLWVQRYDRDPAAEDRGVGLDVSPDGSTVFTSSASRTVSDHFDYVTIGYDADTGSELWTNIYDGPGGSVDQPSAIAANPNGALVYVTGRSVPSTSPSYDYATVAIDTSTGDRVWVKRYDEAEDANEDTDEAVDLGVTPDGSKVFVTGTSQGFESGASTYEDIATQGYDAATGEKLGLREHDACEYRDLARALAISPDGSRLFVTGTSYCPAPDGGIVTLAYPT